MHERTMKNKQWCVYSEYSFLGHVAAFNATDAKDKAESIFSLNKPLNVFPAHETITTYAARNTFSLFQTYGGLPRNWIETNSRLEPILRSELRSLLDCMTHWVISPEAEIAMEMVGSDIEYVRNKIADFNMLLEDPRWMYTERIEIELLANDDRQHERDCAMADAYSDMLYRDGPS